MLHNFPCNKLYMVAPNHIHMYIIFYIIYTLDYFYIERLSLTIDTISDFLFSKYSQSINRVNNTLKLYFYTFSWKRFLELINRVKQTNSYVYDRRVLFESFIEHVIQIYSLRWSLRVSKLTRSRSLQWMTFLSQKSNVKKKQVSTIEL